MSPDEIGPRIADPRVSIDWTAFVAFATELEDDLLEAQKSASPELLNEYVHSLFSLIAERSELFRRLVCCEFIAVTSSPVAFREGFEHVSQLARRDDWESDRVLCQLVGALVLLVLGEVRPDRPEAHNRVEELRRDLVDVLGERYSLVEQFFQSCLQHLDALQSGFPNPVRAPSMKFAQDAYEAFPGMGLLPGDVIFREQELKVWKFRNPMRRFGHAGIYLGCVEGEDPAVAANHRIIHVVDKNPACREEDLATFCNPTGNSLEFWGFYQADLSAQERSNLISLAKSLVGGSFYSFRFYKAPSAAYFRCDGFVEYLYEQVNPQTDPLRYREGLFEKDDWQTLNPAALRNCFSKKFDWPVSVQKP